MICCEQIYYFAQNLCCTASTPPPAAPDPMQYNGLLGDYIGGVWGTGISAITLVVVFITWWAGRQVDYKSKTYQIFVEMLRTHEEVVSSFKVGEQVGRDALEIMLSEFYFIYRATLKLVPNYEDWSIDQRIDIAYTIMYYGTQKHTELELGAYDNERIKKLIDLVTRARQKNSALEAPKDKRRFPGHQNRLSQYFRNLYAAYKFVDTAKLSNEEKDALARTLRAKLSNYEQALLSLNIISHLGRAWESDKLVKRYMPIKNVPRFFFSLDGFDLKARFSYINFEWE